MKFPIYLDYNATTPTDPQVVAAMLPYFTEHFGNAASRNHSFGWTAERVVEACRDRLAGVFHGSGKDLIFTSGATESCNLAIFGAAVQHQPRGRHLITAATEHKAVLDPCRALQRQGWEVSVLEVDREGHLDLNQLGQSIRPDTVLISLMAANNETGTLHPLEAIGALCRERGVLFHTDATQALGKIPLNVEQMNIDLLTVSAHKCYGPKGIGALYVRRFRDRPVLSPRLLGGGHESGLRSGTLNVPGIVGIAKAAELGAQVLEAEATRQASLCKALWEQISRNLEGVFRHGPEAPRLPNTLNLSFDQVDGEALLLGLSEIALASGSACTSSEPHPSYVLEAMGVPEPLARASLRFSIGRPTTQEEIDYVAGRVIDTVQRLRNSEPAP